MAACTLVVTVAFGSACTTTQTHSTGSGLSKNQIHPLHPSQSTGMSAESIHLKRNNEFANIERGETLIITTGDDRSGRVLFYGANAQQDAVYTHDGTGQIRTFPVADITHIHVINDGNISKGAGWGAVAGLGLAAVIAIGFSSAEDGSVRYFGAGFTLLGSPLFAGIGSLTGLIVGAAVDSEYEYDIGPRYWQIRIPNYKKTDVLPKNNSPINTSQPMPESPRPQPMVPTPKPPPAVPIPQTQPVVPAKTTAPVVKTIPNVTPAEKTPVTVKPTKKLPEKLKPAEKKTKKKGSTIQDWIHDKKSKTQTSP